MSDVETTVERHGWVRPERKRTADELRALISQKRTELADLEAELQELEEGPRLEALVQILRIMRAQQLTLEDLDLATPLPRDRRSVRVRSTLAIFDSN